MILTDLRRSLAPGLGDGRTASLGSFCITGCFVRVFRPLRLMYGGVFVEPFRAGLKRLQQIRTHTPLMTKLLPQKGESFH